MDICIISDNPELSLQGDMLFFLAQRLLSTPITDERLLSALQKRYSILDNGAFEEGKSLDWGVVLDLAESYNISEVVLPDIPSEPAQSFKLTADSLESLSKSERTEKSYMGVPHGKTIQEFIEYSKKILQLEVDTLGMSILDLYKWSPRARPIVIHALDNLARNEDRDLPDIHLLGLDEPAELFCYVDVRSVDCSLPISLAYAGRELTFEQQDVERVPENAILSESVIELAKTNIRQLKYFATGNVPKCLRST